MSRAPRSKEIDPSPGEEISLITIPMMEGSFLGDESVAAIRSKCHRDAPLRVYYLRPEGQIYLECAECSKPVCAVQVAGQRPD